MDFGSALCVARPKCEACSLRTRCIYYREKGTREAVVKKKSETGTGDLKDARVMLFLHENHKRYFSSEKKVFRPFILPKGCVVRSEIKRFFLEKHGLTISVRPSHGKLIVGKMPFILVNAQILLGEPTFPVFPKSTVKEYNKRAFRQ